MRPIDADALMKDVRENSESYFADDFAEFWVNRQPTIQSEPHWIPVTERLPKEKDAGILKKLGKNKRSDYVIATVDVKGERMTVTACTYDGVWDWKMKYAFPEYEIVAWMPAPEPYKGVTT